MATSMQVPTSSSTTVLETSTGRATDEQVSNSVLRLRLQKPPNKKVSWTNDTVDNEHMDKKKSKCCCVYVKPHAFDESSSESDDECDHCQGHVEKKKKNKMRANADTTIEVQQPEPSHAPDVPTSESEPN